MLVGAASAAKLAMPESPTMLRSAESLASQLVQLLPGSSTRAQQGKARLTRQGAPKFLISSGKRT